MSSVKKIAISKTKKSPVKKDSMPSVAPKKKEAPAKKTGGLKKTKINVRVVGHAFKTQSESELEKISDLKEKKPPVVVDSGEENLILDEKKSLPKEKDKKEKNKIKQEKIGVKEESAKKIKPKSISLYRRISFSFAFLTILLLAAVFYLYFVSLTIYVTPQKERISDKMTLNIYGDDKKDSAFSSREYIKGAVEKITVSEKKIYEATGIELIGKEISGEVMIINNYNQNQPLRSTTRLLSPDGKLFRIKESVNVPAGGSVKAVIYADEPSKEMAIGPSEFTIPGLWALLQDKIYAKSDKPFVFNSQTKKYIQQSDIDRAIQDLKEVLIKKAEESFGSGYRGYDKIIYEIDKNSIETKVSAKVGEAKEEFEISISAIVNIAGFKSSEAAKIAEEKLISLIPNNKKLAEFSGDNMEYVLSSYNFDSGVAAIETSFFGTMIIEKTEEIVDKEMLVGLNESQLKDYLTNLNKFENFEIVFYPNFMKKAPNLVDKIKIKVK